jgi:hemoglobin-like flavoprotein
MKKFEPKTHPEVDRVFAAYPDQVNVKMQFLRNLVLQTAREIERLDSLEECLKWGEPSFVTKYGSTLRMDWKSKTPDHYALYFKCTSRLVETFREVFGDLFQYEGNRAIILHLDQNIPVLELKSCIKATLTYHKVKHLYRLGF